MHPLVPSRFDESFSSNYSQRGASCYITSGVFAQVHVNFMTQDNKVNQVTNCQVDHRDSIPCSGRDLILHNYIDMSNMAKIVAVLLTSALSLAIYVNKY
jgi:hypothetical protein